MSKANNNLFLKLIAKWPEAASIFDSHDHMCGKIDATELGDAPWQKATLQYREELPARDVPEWMTASYDLFYRDPHIVVKNILSNTTFKGGVDYVPYQEFGHKDERRYENLMSGDWAYKNAVRSLFFGVGTLTLPHLLQDLLATDPDSKGAMFVPIILGSDKTTVSVATGHTEYWPLYVSIGNVHNTVRRAHANAVALIAFLAIPRSECYSGRLSSWKL